MYGSVNLLALMKVQTEAIDLQRSLEWSTNTDTIINPPLLMDLLGRLVTEPEQPCDRLLGSLKSVQSGLTLLNQHCLFPFGLHLEGWKMAVTRLFSTLVPDLNLSSVKAKLRSQAWDVGDYNSGDYNRLASFCQPSSVNALADHPPTSHNWAWIYFSGCSGPLVSVCDGRQVP